MKHFQEKGKHDTDKIDILRHDIWHDSAYMN